MKPILTNVGKGVNPKNAKKLLKNKSKNKIFENKRDPILVHEDFEKPGPHLPRYQSI